MAGWLAALAGWLAGWLGWLAGWLAGVLAGCLAVWLAGLCFLWHLFCRQFHKNGSKMIALRLILPALD
jgi:chromate transport protein ChrA